MTKGKNMAAQAEDKQTKQIFEDEEKQLMLEALKTHQEKVGRKAAADAPQQIKMLWRNELKKIEELARS
jgi:hypothetical protein